MGVAPDELEGLRREVTRLGRVEQRMERLLAVSGDLAGARTREDIARIVIDRGLRAVGASYGAFWVVDPDEDVLRLLAVSPLPRGTVDRWRVIPLEVFAPLTQAVRTSTAIFLDSLAEFEARFPASYARIRDTVSSSDPAYANIPLVVEGGAGSLGAIAMTYDHAADLDSNERTFLSILGRQCGLALERLRLHDAERGSRRAAEAAARRQSLLAELGTLLTSSLELLPAMGATARVIVPALADCCVIRDAAGSVLAVTHRDPALEDQLASLLARPATRISLAMHTGETMVHAEVLPELVEQLGYPVPPRSVAQVPLRVSGRVVGELALAMYGSGRSFTSGDVAFLDEVGRRLALGVEQASLYGSERSARAHAERAEQEERAAHFDAEEATRAREEILSVVSHDLRNPLGTILMGASTLLQLADPSDQKGLRIRTIAERINRQAERMARLIEDLVDFAGIQAGKLSIARGSHAPSAIVDGATELLGPLALERGLAFDAHTPKELPLIDCDDARVSQILSNLVGNAVKVTPKGGRITVGAKLDGAQVVFFVSDTGPGIDPDELPLLFERYWRSKQTTYKGAGLGLSIARGIVAAHGGKIWAESVRGKGCTFLFTLGPA